jgi:hypothetical protein
MIQVLIPIAGRRLYDENVREAQEIIMGMLFDPVSI